MGLFKKLSGMFSSSERLDADVYWIDVQCNRCGEEIRTRVDLRNDLSIEYGEGEREMVYYCRKVLMGQELCFQRVEVHLKFNQKRELIEHEISGGKFISDQGYFKAGEEVT